MGRRQVPSSSQKTCSRNGCPCSTPIFASASPVMMAGVTTWTKPAAVREVRRAASSSTRRGTRRVAAQLVELRPAGAHEPVLEPP